MNSEFLISEAGMDKLFQNQVLIAALIAWFLAQVIKVPVEYFRSGKINWALLLSAGGMPSSHSAIVTAGVHGIGLFHGFDTPLFAFGFIMAMVVIYDATGIRRQAGKHASIINEMIRNLAKGDPIRKKHEQKLKEALGHTPVEAILGVAWGLVVSTVVWLLWP